MDFNFDSILTTDSFSPDVTQYLKPYDVYPVRITKFEKTDLKGSKDPNAVYKVVTVEFSGESGTFSENLFVPSRDDDFIRRENESNHKTYPSAFERFNFTLMQLVENTCPKSFNKVKEAVRKIPIKDRNSAIDTFVNIISQAINKEGKNTDIFIKLVGRNSNGTVYATLPSSCWFDSNIDKVKPLPFVSTDKSKLTFSSYEMREMEKYKKAAPTPMEDVEADKSDDSELNLDSLDFDI